VSSAFVPILLDKDFFLAAAFSFIADLGLGDRRRRDTTGEIVILF